MTESITLFKNIENTIAPAATHHRIEGFLSGIKKHNSGTGLTMFLNDVRGEDDKKTKHVVVVNVWGADADYIASAAQYRKNQKDAGEQQDAVFISVDCQWSCEKFGTGEMVGEYEKTRAILSFNGRNVILVNPSQSDNQPRSILHMVNTSITGLPLFKDIPNTLAPAEWYQRVEGFLSGIKEHDNGDGLTMFLNSTRTINGNKKYHVAMISVFGIDAKMIRDAANSSETGLFFSVSARWSAPVFATGEKDSEGKDKTRSVMSFVGRNVLQVNPKCSEDFPRCIIRSSETHDQYLKSLQS